MNMQPQLQQELKTEKSHGFQDFSERMTTGIAVASGGAAIGTFFGGPIGATVVGLVTGVVAFVASGSHHDAKTHN